MAIIPNERSIYAGRTRMDEQFEKGDRVVRTETGETGVVRRQFIDGYVSMDYDDGRGAQLPASSLEREGQHTL